MSVLALLAAAALAQSGAAAGPAVQPPSLTCGAAPMPGLAEFGSDGVWRGYLVSLCRRIASATGRDPARIAFRGYGDDAALAHARGDDVAFLSPAELASRAVSGGLLDGPVVSHDRQLLIARAGAKVQPPSALAGQLICFIAGTRAEDALTRWAAKTHVRIEYLPFQEPVEMADAFAVGKCAAEAVDIADIASPRDVRVLATLESLPILVATPAARGAEWRDAVVGALALQPGAVTATP